MGLTFSLSRPFNRLSPQPIDESSVFSNHSALTAYADTDPTAYDGQVCSVSALSSVYIIVNKRPIQIQGAGGGGTGDATKVYVHNNFLPLTGGTITRTVFGPALQINTTALGNASPFIVDDRGYLGIGNASPNNVLDVTGTVRLSGTVAGGLNTTPTGDFSHSEGEGSAAEGHASHSQGKDTRAQGNYSHAEGFGTVASGFYSHSEGSNTTAKGESSHSEGWGASAIGGYSHAEGFLTEAIGSVSHAEGMYNIAREYNSHAAGNGAEARHSRTWIWNGPAEAHFSNVPLISSDRIGQFKVVGTGGIFLSGSSGVGINTDSVAGNALTVAGNVSATGQVIDANTPGYNWTLRSGSPINNAKWQSVAYGNGIFVAVAAFNLFNKLMWSSDGINWNLAPVTYTTNQAPDNFHAQWRSVTYGNGLFVAVADGGFPNNIAVSPDGINWSGQRFDNGNSAWYSVAYGNGRFVAVARLGTHNVMTSLDGFNWAQSTVSNDYAWRCVTYADGLFVAVADSPDTGSWSTAANQQQIMTSPDGITWTGRSIASVTDHLSLQLCGVTYGNGLYVAVSRTGSRRILTSPDGITWTSRVAPGNSNWVKVAYGEGLFVAVADSGQSGDPRIITSTDGINWTQRGDSSVWSQDWYDVTYGNGLFVAVAADAFSVMTSGRQSLNNLEKTSNNTTQGNRINYGNSTIVGNISALGTLHSLSGSVVEGNSLSNIARGLNSHIEGRESATGMFELFSYGAALSTFTFTNTQSSTFNNIFAGDTMFGYYIQNLGSGSGEARTPFRFVVASRSTDTGSISAGRLNITLPDAAIGYLFNNQRGVNSHAEGFRNIAAGDYGHAEGRGCIVYSEASHVEGMNCIAGDKDAPMNSFGAHAEGNFTRAIGGYSHAEGSGCIAEGINSHAAGLFSKAAHSLSWIWAGVTNSSLANTPDITTDNTGQFKVVATGNVFLSGTAGVGINTQALTGNALTIAGAISSNGNLNVQSVTVPVSVITLSTDRVFTSTDTNDVFHFDTTSSVLTAIFPPGLPDGFNIAIMNTGTNRLYLSAAGTTLKSIGRFLRDQYAGAFVYRAGPTDIFAVGGL